VAFLVILSTALSVLSQAGLIASVAALREGQPGSFSATWRSGMSNFWHMLGLQVVLFLAGVLLFLFTVLPAVLVSLVIFNFSEPGFASVLIIVAVALLTVVFMILLFIPFSIIGALAARSLVLDSGRVFGSLGDGYTLFRNNLGRSILVWLIQIGLALVIGLLLALLTFATGYPVSSLLAPLLAGFSLSDLVLAAGALFVFSIPFLILSAAVSSFLHAYWTIAYLQLRHGGDDNSSLGQG
jgi:hypothetical protein